VTVTPIITPIPVFGPINAVTPFTYRDNDTFQTQLRGLRDKVNEFIEQLVLVDGSLRSDLGQLITDLTNDLNMQLTTIDTTTQAQIDAFDVRLTDMFALSNVGLDARVTTAETTVATFDARITANATKAGRPIHAYDYGVMAGTGTDQKTSLYAAMAAAEAAGGGTVVVLPPGIITIAGSLSLSGYSCGLVGAGASTVSANSNIPAGTVLQAITQTGPVLDFTGWRGPNNFVGRVRFGGFSIAGSGVVGANNKGIYIGDSSNNGGKVIGISMRDITITNTGGIGFDLKAVYLSDFDAITITNPVDAFTNNTSYARISGGNGCRFRGLGLRSLLTTGDVPALGALRCIPEGLNEFHDMLMDGLWLENLHVPTNGAAVIMQTNRCVISDMQMFDTFKEPAAIGTSILRFEPSGVGNEGGNIFRGIIPGNNTATNCIDNGICLRQNGNRIEGVKSYRRWNVIIDAGVSHNFVSLGGGEGILAGATTGIVDNSNNTTNVLMDGHAPMSRAFAPVLTGSVTNPVIGNGVIDSRWTREPDGTVHYSGVINFGTTTTVGSGNYSISLPVPADPTVDYHGTGRAATTGVGCAILPKTFGSDVLQIFVPPTSAALSPLGLLANTGLLGVAWALSSATTIRWSITYMSTAP
jgi:hypothetical protein